MKQGQDKAILVRIYGLPPKDKDDTKVFIYDYETYGTENAIELFQGTPDELGRLFCEIPKEYLNKKIKLLVIPDRFSHISEVLDVTPLGVFHTVSLTRDMGGKYGLHEQLPVEPTSWRQKAQNEMKIDFRNAKYKNKYSKTVYWVLTAISPFIGLILGGVVGLVLGVVVTVILLFIGSYAFGYKKGI